MQRWFLTKKQGHFFFFFFFAAHQPAVVVKPAFAFAQRCPTGSNTLHSHHLRNNSLVQKVGFPVSCCPAGDPSPQPPDVALRVGHRSSSSRAGGCSWQPFQGGNLPEPYRSSKPAPKAVVSDGVGRHRAAFWLVPMAKHFTYLTAVGGLNRGLGGPCGGAEQGKHPGAKQLRGESCHCHLGGCRGAQAHLKYFGEQRSSQAAPCQSGSGSCARCPLGQRGQDGPGSTFGVPELKSPQAGMRRGEATLLPT